MAFIGVGTKFQKKESGVYEDLANLISISGPSVTRDTVDSTKLNDADNYRNFITGLRDGGTMSFDIEFDKTQYQELLTDFESDTEQEYEIFFAKAQAGAVQFKGLLTDLPIDVPLDDKVTVSVTVKVTGGITVPASGPYLVQYDANGAESGTVPADQTKEDGVDLTLRTNSGSLSLTGYNFVGWNTAADGSGTSHAEGATFSLDAQTTLYAEWVVI